MRRALAPYLLMALFGLLICCTRTSEVKTAEKTAFQQELNGRERDRSTEVVQSGPETITTTVEEWSEPEKETAPTEEGADSVVALPTGAAVLGGTVTKRSVSPAPILVKRTVTVDQRGPSTDTKTNVATKVESASLTEKQDKASDTKKRTSYWPPLWLILVGLALLGLGGWALRNKLARFASL